MTATQKVLLITARIAAGFGVYGSQWICSDIGNWYEGFMPRYLSTNNGLERANRTLKDSYTLHVKLGMAEFLNKMEESLTRWSLKEDCNS